MEQENQIIEVAVEEATTEKKELPPLLYLAVYPKKRKNGVSYIGFPKLYDSEKDVYKKRKAKEGNADYVTIVWSAECRDAIYNLASEYYNGVFPPYYIAAEEYAMRATVNMDGTLAKTKDGKQLHTLFINSAQFIKPVPDVRVSVDSTFE